MSNVIKVDHQFCSHHYSRAMIYDRGAFKRWPKEVLSRQKDKNCLTSFPFCLFSTVKRTLCSIKLSTIGFDLHLYYDTGSSCSFAFSCATATAQNYSFKFDFFYLDRFLIHFLDNFNYFNFVRIFITLFGCDICV